MKIIKIEKTDNNIFSVHLKPNWLEKLFNIQPKVVRYKDTDREYISTNQTVYLKENGKFCKNEDWIAKKIDRLRRSF